jgi:hypothetical protein
MIRDSSRAQPYFWCIFLDLSWRHQNLIRFIALKTKRYNYDHCNAMRCEATLLPPSPQSLPGVETLQ